MAENDRALPRSQGSDFSAGSAEHLGRGQVRPTPYRPAMPSNGLVRRRGFYPDVLSAPSPEPASGSLFNETLVRIYPSRFPVAP